MPKILLDTQVLVWLVSEPKKLGSKATATLHDPANRLLLSYFSLFEIVIKASIGKMTYDSSIVKDLEKLGIELVIPGTNELNSYKIYNPRNKDPFDNMLISVALAEKARLATSDRKILEPNIKNLKTINALT